MAGISIRGLAKNYAGKTDMAALSNLDLEIGDSQFVTLLGPSGCGKTTTLRLIAGYLVPDAGTIHVNGKLLSSTGSVVSPENRGMGMVFQNYAVWPHKTVFENVVFGLKLRKTPAAQMKDQVERMLALVNLAGLEGRFPNELSGGQQQRVALARSLVVEPDILLLDEPLSNLDAKLRERMRTELKELQRRTGITFIYVTARPGRSARAVRPGRGDAWRQAPAIWLAARGLCQADQPHRRRLHGAGEHHSGGSAGPQPCAHRRRRRAGDGPAGMGQGRRRRRRRGASGKRAPGKPRRGQRAES